MSNKIISVKVYRSESGSGSTSSYDSFQVPLESGMSAMDVLDYIYQNQDSTLAYYDHAGCGLGICVRCTGKVNGKAGLLCQTIVNDDIVINPSSELRVLKDLVCERGKKQPSNQ